MAKITHPRIPKTIVVQQVNQALGTSYAIETKSIYSLTYVKPTLTILMKPLLTNQKVEFNQKTFTESQIINFVQAYSGIVINSVAEIIEDSFDATFYEIIP